MVSLAKKNKTTLIFEEYKRLKNLFVGQDENKIKLVDELLKKASFLKVELENLESIIIDEGFIETTARGGSSISGHYKAYLQTVGVYQNLIKTINGIFGKQVVKDDDDFDEFMKKAGGI